MTDQTRLIETLRDELIAAKTDAMIADARANLAFDILEVMYHTPNGAGVLPLPFEESYSTFKENAEEEKDYAALFSVSFLEGNRFGKEPPVEDDKRERQRFELNRRWYCRGFPS